MGSSPLDTSESAPSVEPVVPGAGADRPESLPNRAYGLAAVVLILPPLIWSVGALALSVLLEW